MTVKEYTAYYQLEIPDYDVPGWHQYIDRNFHAIDGTLYLLTGVTNIRGVWKNNTVYNVGDRAVDHLTNTIHQCAIQNTSPPTGTFQAYRAANPTHWSTAVELYPSTVTSRIEFLNTDDAVTTTDASVEFRGGVGIAKRLLVGSYVSIASADQMGIAVGRQGRTDPSFSVWCATINSVTGVRIIGQPGAGGVDIDVTSPGGNEDLRINAKGTGKIILGNVSTGAVTIVSASDFQKAVNIGISSTAALTVGSGVLNSNALRVKTDLMGGAVGTGIMILGQPAGSGAVINVLSGNANEDLLLDAKGTGRVVLGSGSTGVITTARVLTVTNATGSTASTNGAAVITGGIGVGGNSSFGGSVDVIGNVTLGAAGALFVNAIQVVNGRKTGWAASTGTATRTTFDTATVTLPQLAERVHALLTDIRGHGMIGT